MYKTPIHLLIAILFCACSDASDPQPARDPIVLNAGVRGEAAVSRGDGAIGNSSALSISLFRADEIYGTAYVEGPVPAVIRVDRAINTGMFYLPDETKKSKLIALYPTATNYVVADRKVTYTAIDGATDIMASNTVEGSESQPIADKMTFDHLLTRIIVKIKAGSIADVNAWGPVQSISVVGKKQDIVLTLPAPDSGAGKATIATGGTAADLALTADDGAAIAATPIPIGTTAQRFGQAMFAPVAAGETLTIAVVAEHRSCTLDADPQAFEAGNEYTIVLTFGAIDAKIETVTITPWQPTVDLYYDIDSPKTNARPGSTDIADWSTETHGDYDL